MQSEFTGEFRAYPCKRPGTFRCGGCNLCQYMYAGENVILPNGKVFKLVHYANCIAIGVVYMLMCQCGAFYVGKTKQPFHKKTSRHITCMRKQCPELPLGRHVRDIHDSRIPKIKFLILDRINTNTRGGDWNRNLLHRETRWIAILKATSAPGLNDVNSYRPFLEGFASGGWEEQKYWTIPSLLLFFFFAYIWSMMGVLMCLI